MNEPNVLKPANGISKGFRGSLQRISFFLRVKQLEYRLWESERFQSYCIRNQFKSLAELEAETGRQLRRQIQSFKEALHREPHCQGRKITRKLCGSR